MGGFGEYLIGIAAERREKGADMGANVLCALTHGHGRPRGWLRM